MLPKQLVKIMTDEADRAGPVYSVNFERSLPRMLKVDNGLVQRLVVPYKPQHNLRREQNRSGNRART